ncbi:hypothetical protein DB835_03095, partial [Xanthomonas perforans]
PAPRPSPRLRRGRSKPRAPVARKLCLFAPQGEGFNRRGVTAPEVWRRMKWAMHPLAYPSLGWAPAG